MTKIALVSYLNTIPFLHGLEEVDDGDCDFEIMKEVPSKCASAFRDGLVDVALLPVGALPNIGPYDIITDYCIGCDGEVQTVVLFSHQKLSTIKRIYLDEDSRTSYNLIKVILGDFMKQTVEFINGIPKDPTNISEDEGVLMIGDKVFPYLAVFNHAMDLGKMWKLYTNLPFAFAVWVKKHYVDDGVVGELNRRLKMGVDHIDLGRFKSTNPKIDLDTYLSKYISYSFDQAKQEALIKYLGLAKKYIKHEATL